MMSWQRSKASTALIALLTAGMASSATAQTQTRMSVNNGENIRRTCPSLDCGAIGRFYQGESVVVYETLDGWSRVSLYYTAGCNDGRSAFVDTGSDACTTANGIRNGEFAEWIRSDFLGVATDIAG